MEAIIISIISGICSILGVILTSFATCRRLQHQLEIAQAVTDTKLESLTGEVRTLGSCAHRLPVAEEQIANLRRRMDGWEREHHA